MKNENDQVYAYSCNNTNIENFEGGAAVLGQPYTCLGDDDNSGLSQHGIFNEIYLTRKSANPLPFDVDKTDTTLGVYGKDWMYVLTGPNIPKFTYVVSYDRRNHSGWKNHEIVSVSTNVKGVDPGYIATGPVTVTKLAGPMMAYEANAIYEAAYPAGK